MKFHILTLCGCFVLFNCFFVSMVRTARSDICTGKICATRMVKDICSNEYDIGFFREFTDVNGMLFFLVKCRLTDEYQLWKSDGTASGTVRVKDINPDGDDQVWSLTNVNGTLFFTAETDRSLWKSNGTAVGTVRVKDINPDGYDHVGGLTNVNGTLFFSGNDEVKGYELWKSDGTAIGTVMVKDIWDVPHAGSDPGRLTAAASLLYFSANDGTNGTELWRSNGTEAGTVMVKDINTAWRAGSGPQKFLYMGNGLAFFSADDGSHGRELWMTNGTGAGTVLVEDIFQYGLGCHPDHLTKFVTGTQPYDMILAFSADNGLDGRELYGASYGFGAGMVKDINHITGIPLDSNPEYLTVVNDTLLFAATASGTGRELWKSNGAEAGTMLVRDIHSAGSSSPEFLTNVKGDIYFSADNGSSGRELWRSDGTFAGTVMVSNINPFGDSSPQDLININNTLFFSADDGIHGRTLWKREEIKEPFPWLLFYPAILKNDLGNGH